MGKLNILIKQLWFFLFPFVSLFFNCQTEVEKEKLRSKPNIIYILADDLGYGDIGVYGQKKIETPNLDELASNGMIFTQHYAGAPVCAPARYMLLTGKHSGHSYIRGNYEWKERGNVWDYRAMIADSTLEGQFPIPTNSILFPQLLQKEGYTTGMVGKWGLGAPHTNSIPTKMGFDFFFGYNCQRQAHTYFPVHLYKNENRVYLNNDTIPPNTKLAKGANPFDSKSYSNFKLNEYAPDLMFKEMISFISENKQNPFFLYWATPIPHNPLQAPQKWINYYKEKFGEEKPYLGQNGYFPNQNPRAAYAAMISYLDENIGKLIMYLKDKNLYDNTLILFSSDNGVTYSGGTDGKFFNSSGIFGESFGRGKGFVYEGGIRVPMIATWGKKIKPGSITNHISAHYDVMATLLELINYENIPETDGISFLPTLTGKKEQDIHDFLYWEFPEYGGQVAIRIGDWKVIRRNLKRSDKKSTLELYNLSIDPEELNNVVINHSDIIQIASDIFGKEHIKSEIEEFRIHSIENGFFSIQK